MSSFIQSRGDTWKPYISNLSHNEDGAAVDLSGASVICSVAGLTVSTESGGVAIYPADAADGIRVRALFLPADTATVTPRRTPYRGEFQITLASGVVRTERFQLRVSADDIV